MRIVVPTGAKRSGGTCGSVNQHSKADGGACPTFCHPTGAKRSREPALSEVEWGSAVLQVRPGNVFSTQSTDAGRGEGVPRLRRSDNVGESRCPALPGWADIWRSALRAQAQTPSSIRFQVQPAAGGELRRAQVLPCQNKVKKRKAPAYSRGFSRSRWIALNSDQLGDALIDLIFRDKPDDLLCNFAALEEKERRNATNPVAHGRC
jgi:hypothetical protein